MSTPLRPSLKSHSTTPTGPCLAVEAGPGSAVGEPKGAARKGVPSVLRPDPHPGDGRYPVAWLCIAAPRGAVPTATSKCLCGRDRSAVGRPKVLALVDDHAAHRDACPLRTNQEGRQAA